MKALIISGGKPIHKKKALKYAQKSDIIICADKGYDYSIKYGIKPDIILGDMDSIESNVLEESLNTIVYPSQKDYTDTHIAVHKAIEKGANEIDIICGTGSRMDHTLANIRLLLLMKEHNVKGRIIDDSNVIFLCTDEVELNKKENTLISILPFSDKVEGITLKGFKYPLTYKNADFSWTEGISNEIIADSGIISIKSGMLLVFQSED